MKISHVKQLSEMFWFPNNKFKLSPPPENSNIHERARLTGVEAIQPSAERTLGRS